jgi:hypothetical protein
LPAALHRFADVVEGYHVPARDPLQERPTSPTAFRPRPRPTRSAAAALRELASDPERARRIAEAGSAQVRARMDVRIGAAQKLQGMGFRIADRGAAGAAARG